jgi:hypothetical protein
MSRCKKTGLCSGLWSPNDNERQRQDTSENDHGATAKPATPVQFRPSPPQKLLQDPVFPLQLESTSVCSACSYQRHVRPDQGVEALYAAFLMRLGHSPGNEESSVGVGLAR